MRQAMAEDFALSAYLISPFLIPKSGGFRCVTTDSQLGTTALGAE